MKLSIINFEGVRLVVGSVRWRTRNIQGGRYLPPGKSDPDMADRQRASHTNKVDDKQKHKQSQKTEIHKQQLSDML